MVTKRDAIIDALRRQIMAGEIERGAPLRQDEVASWYKASITPVREALHRLEAEGLVVSEPHRGVRVAGVDIDRVKTIYVKRMLLEPYAIKRSLLRLTRLDLKSAYHIIDQLAESIETDDRLERNKRTREFHFFFYDRCGLPGLRDEIASSWDAFPWDLTLDNKARADESHSEHIAMVEAAKAVDTELIAKQLEDHIRHGVAKLLTTLTGNEQADPFDIEND